jgi:TP901 family phage tail tape measure protein
VAESLGTIRGQLILDVKQALSAYTETRLQHLNTVTALHTGAGAMQQSGAAIAGVGGIMVAGFGMAVGAAAEFEKKLDYFGAVSASTQGEYEAIRQKALDLGADTIYSANQIADSFIELGKSGVSAKDIINGIGEGVANLAAAADIPLDTAANIITSSVATFGLSADKAVMVADRLAGAANASTVDVEDLGVSMKYAGGVASSLGFSFEETNTALALLGKYGIKGSTAGTSLRQVMLGLNGSTDKARNALKSLGIITADGANQFFKADGSAKSLSEVFQILQDKTAGMSDQQKTATMQQIFATRALPSLIALTNAGAEGFEEMAAAVEKTTAMEVAGKRLDNLSGDIEVLKGNLDTLFIQGGSGFQGFARGVVQAVTDMVQSFMDLPAGVQTGFFALLLIGGIALVAIGSLGLLAGSIMNLIALGLTLGPAWKAMITAIKAFRGITIVAAGAQWVLNAALAANPIGIVILAIAALVAGLIWFFTQTEVGRAAWSSFMTWLGEAWANIVSVATTVWGALSSFFSTLWTNIGNFFQTAVTTIQAILTAANPMVWIPALWNALPGFFAGLWNMITTGVQTLVTNIVNFFIALPGQIGAFLMALPGMIGYALGFLLGSIVRIFIEIGTWLFTNVPIIVNNVVGFFQQLPILIAVWLAQLLNDVIAWVAQMSLNMLNGAMNIVNGVVQFFSELPAKIIAFIVAMVTGAIAWFRNFQVQAAQAAIAIVNGVVDFFQNFPERVTTIFRNMVTFAINAFRAGIALSQQIASNIVNTIRDTINALPGLVTGIFNKVIGAIRGMITQAFNAVKSFAAGLWNGFKDGLGIHSPSYIEHAMWAITGVIDDETRHMRKQVRIVQGLGNGISAIGDNLSFGDGIDNNLAQLYDAVAATRQLESELSANSSLGVESTQNLAMAGMADQLKGLKQETTVNVQIDNPEPEPSSESLPKAVRQATFMIG